MLNNSLLIFTIICVSKTIEAYTPTALDDALNLATDFFEKLKKDYELVPPSQDVLNKIDAEIAKYVDELKRPGRSRHRRQLNGLTYDNEGIGVLDGFEELPGTNLSKAFDLSFFVHLNGAELQWFVATLGPSEVSIFQFNGNYFTKVGSYSISNGMSLATDGSGSGTVLVISKSDGSVIVLRLRQENEGLHLYLAQHLDAPGVSHLTLWRGMNQLYLGRASKTNISIYHWLGEHFDLIQTLNFGAEKLIAFRTGGSMHLAAIGTQTFILKFLLQSNQFVMMEKLSTARDVTTFDLEKGHQKEHYMALCGMESTILYKLVQDRFVPFQNIVRADKISCMITKETAVLLLLKGNGLKVYQYDGWKFDELAVTMSEVQEIYPTTLHGDVVLSVRYTNGDWKLSKPIWTQKSTWKILRNEVKSWCLEARDKAKRQPASIPVLKEPVHILNGRIGVLHAHNVNGKNTDELISLTHRYETLMSNLAKGKQSLSSMILTESPKFKTLHAANVRVKCTAQCKANKVVTAVKDDIIGKLARPNSENRNLEFATIRVESTDSLPCPKPAVVLKDATVSGFLNGISFQALQEETLRVTGDQEVMGEHIFANLEVTSGLIPLGIATQATQQEIHAYSMKANELHLTQGGILVPLNGTPVSISGAKIVSKAKIKGPVHLRGSLRGKAVDSLKPLTHVDGPLELWGNYSVEGVNIRNQLTAKDLTGAAGRSLLRIFNEAIPLNVNNIPVHLILSGDKTFWTNVTMDSLPKYVTVLSNNSNGIINITGKKYTPHNLTLTKESYDALPIQKLHGKLCALEASIPGVQTSTMAIDRATVDSIITEQIFGASTLNYIMLDTAKSTASLSLAAKSFVGNVKVKNSNLSAIDDIDFEGLLASMVGWIEPGLLNGTMEASNVVVDKLFASNGFPPLLPVVAKNLIAKGNLYIVSLNNVNITDFAQNVVKLDEMISLTNIMFGGGLIANELYASVAPVNFTSVQALPANMGSKIIVGKLESASLSLPYSLVHPPSNVPTNLIMKGSAVFVTEPKIENVNGHNLDKTSEEIWMVNKPTVLSNRLFEIRNLVLEGPTKVLGSLNSPTHGSWATISSRILSKTRPQEINAHVVLSNAKAGNVIGTETSNLRAPTAFLDGLGQNSLKKDGVQVVTADMQFQQIKIPGDLDAYSTINGINLTTGIVRSDAKKNIVTGKKIVPSLTAQNINGGLNFGQWYKNTLNTKTTGNLIVVKGWKTFSNITIFKDLRVGGTVMAHKIENSLLKSPPQQISGWKSIQGNLIAPHLFIDGQINDVNLTTMEHQMKKNKTIQRIRTSILLQGKLEVLGDVTVNGLYYGVELKNLSKVNATLAPVIGRMAKLMDFAEGVDMALKHRAWYWNKLELIEENSMAITPYTPTNDKVTFEGLGECEMKEGTLICDGHDVRGVILLPKLIDMLLCRVVSLGGTPLVVLATSDFQGGGAWIYAFDIIEKKFYQTAGVNFYGATQASAIATAESLWLAIQFSSNTMILRYELWGEFEEYNLPGTGPFLMNIAPTRELLIFRPDGVWRLGGVADPRHIFEAPLKGQVNTFVHGTDYYIQLTQHNHTSLFKTRYIGD